MTGQGRVAAYASLDFLSVWIETTHGFNGCHGFQTLEMQCMKIQIAVYCILCTPWIDFIPIKGQNGENLNLEP